MEITKSSRLIFTLREENVEFHLLAYSFLKIVKTELKKLPDLHTTEISTSMAVPISFKSNSMLNWPSRITVCSTVASVNLLSQVLL